MQKFDMHIHADGAKPDPEAILSEMAKAGIWGGCIFSCPPKQYSKERGRTFEERMEEVLAWANGYEDRIFPVIWIHPYEENLIENIRLAVERGIAGFKMICCDYYVYEARCLEVLREIAKLNKPVFFHSGILWSGTVSSKYNRPLNWEPLMEIEGLRFSMGHCSWPWIDECIALYGKFLNSLTTRNTAEMFFDITPGTPKIYREELLRKLYTIGYDVGNNIMFGTDATASHYNAEWAKSWCDCDREILMELGVSEENISRLYHDNLLRFFGKTEPKIAHISPVCDAAQEWKAQNPDVPAIIEKWYKTLGFPKRFDAEFYRALETLCISDAVALEDIRNGITDGKRSLLTFLYLCEGVAKRYREKGIPEKILLDTLRDIVVWTKTWSKLKNELWLGETGWLKNHMRMKLYKLGRLQFCMGYAEHDIPSHGVKEGEPVIEIHIPEGEPLDPAACSASIEQAKVFFAEFFPEWKYRCFTTHTWLLDSTITELLPQTSNILAFQQMFEIVSEDVSDAIFKYVFRWNADRDEIFDMEGRSGFAKAVKNKALSGAIFHETLGVLKEKEHAV